MSRLTRIWQRMGPPWLSREVGTAYRAGVGTVIDLVRTRTAESISARFPSADREDMLGPIGRDRRILRGPGESAVNFVSRLLRWWDAHRGRGGPYELLRQLQGFLRGFLDIRIDCVANSGTHHWIALDGTITRGAIAGWSGDGYHPERWARIFLIFLLDSDTIDFPLLSESGEPILTESGEPILVTVSIYALSDEDRRIFCTVAREWSAAHVDRIYIRLLPPGGWLWGYPPDARWGDEGRVWGDGLAAGWTC